MLSDSHLSAETEPEPPLEKRLSSPKNSDDEHDRIVAYQIKIPSILGGSILGNLARFCHEIAADSGEELEALEAREGDFAGRVCGQSMGNRAGLMDGSGSR